MYIIKPRGTAGRLISDIYTKYRNSLADPSFRLHLRIPQMTVWLPIKLRENRVASLMEQTVDIAEKNLRRGGFEHPVGEYKKEESP